MCVHRRDAGRIVQAEGAVSNILCEQLERAVSNMQLEGAVSNMQLEGAV
jgi:signal recognition particle subunit SEC65